MLQPLCSLDGFQAVPQGTLWVASTDAHSSSAVATNDRTGWDGGRTGRDGTHRKQIQQPSS